MKLKSICFSAIVMAGITLGASAFCQTPARQPKDAVGAVGVNGRTAMELASDIYAGVNIGNTMECPNGEGDWTMPINKAYVKTLATLGFNAVRIPCAWDSHADEGIIDQEWLDRVDEVVGWVLDAGMYAILNVHWDGGWIEVDPCLKGYDKAADLKFRNYWTQIARQLRHYDQRLLFAALNEPQVDGNDDASKKRSIDAIMKYEQTMLDAVRSTGGNNLDRVLIMPAPVTDIEQATAGYFHLPKDKVEDRMMVEAHFYGPYNFNMMTKDEDWGKYAWYWGKENFVEGSDRDSTWGDEQWVREQFQSMKQHYTDKGIPGIMGEYSVCAIREDDPGIDKNKWMSSVRLWNKVVTEEAKNAGMVPFYWEIGQDISRIDGTVLRYYQLQGVLEGAAQGAYPFSEQTD